MIFTKGTERKWKNSLMTMRVLICDDSKLARKQMAASLPEDWDVEISFAENGQEALELIKEGKGNTLFLDLNMPVMDGYETLSYIHQHNLDCMTIVVSGDIQPEAHARVKKLGAIDFIKKPVDCGKLASLLDNYGLYRRNEDFTSQVFTQEESHAPIDYRECMQEVVNVAMGQAADLLARLLNAFVKLPIPNVNLIDFGELEMALSAANQGHTYTAVCQGFIGGGISGEALLLFNDASYTDMANLLNYQGDVDATAELELVMECASILGGACINGIAEQLNIMFSQSHPQVLGQNLSNNNLLHKSNAQWKQTLAVEILYEIENHNISCDLLLLFTEDSLDKLYQRLDYMMN
jgi:chemotaxis protein CheY-P-specific phosphatase CheC